jgi:hypothetical protein
VHFTYFPDTGAFYFHEDGQGVLRLPCALHRERQRRVVRGFRCDQDDLHRIEGRKRTASGKGRGVAASALLALMDAEPLEHAAQKFHFEKGLSGA